MIVRVAELQRTKAGAVLVRIDETRHQNLSGQIDMLGIRKCRRQAFARANRYDELSLYGHARPHRYVVRQHHSVGVEQGDSLIVRIHGATRARE